MNPTKPAVDLASILKPGHVHWTGDTAKIEEFLGDVLQTRHWWAGRVTDCGTIVIKTWETFDTYKEVTVAVPHGAWLRRDTEGRIWTMYVGAQ